MVSKPLVVHLMGPRCVTSGTKFSPKCLISAGFYVMGVNVRKMVSTMTDHLSSNVFHSQNQKSCISLKQRRYFKYSTFQRS